MQVIHQILLIFHIVMGSVALISFWIPVFAKKGGKIHVKVGKVYVSAMWMVILSAIILCLLNVVEQNYFSAGFLGFLALLTAPPLWYGIVIIKHKKHVPERLIQIRKYMAIVLFTCALGLIAWSISLKVEGNAVLLLIFGLLGLTEAPLIFRSIEKQQDTSNWLIEHLEGMIGSGIAANTAFLVFGGSNILNAFFPSQFQVVFWVLPTIIGLYFGNRLSKRIKMAKA